MTTAETWTRDTWQTSYTGGRGGDDPFRKIINQVGESLLEAKRGSAQYLLLEQAFEELDSILNEFSEANWDGYEAIPIKEDAIQETKDFLSLLGSKLPALSLPEITPEGDGGIELEWYSPETGEFTLSFDGQNTITYSGIFSDTSETLGTTPFNMVIPSIIETNIQRITK